MFIRNILFPFCPKFHQTLNFYEVLTLTFSQIKSMKTEYNILMYSLLCRFTHCRVDQLPKNFVQYNYFAKISEKYFGKILSYENKYWENFGKTRHLTFKNLDLLFLSFVCSLYLFSKTINHLSSFYNYKNKERRN